jgi:glutathione synthase/RimK-type ligase-like ATP-grasp enzyme
VVVVDRPEDWHPGYPELEVVEARAYLTEARFAQGRDLLVINLCRSRRYQSTGYYCSLLAEARGQRVLPSVRTTQDLAGGAAYSTASGMDARARRYLRSVDGDRLQVDVYFGECSEPALAALAREVFDTFRCPLVRLDLRRRDAWRVNRVRNLPLHRLPAAARQDYAAALERYLTHRWREPRARARYRYDLALLQDPGDPMPPSNRRALERFGRAGRRLGLDTELIGPRDLGRLAEYDALFIRATTQVNHFTYRFARRAEREGMAVIDDPSSILRCTNKVYLSELLGRSRVPVPTTVVLTPHRLDLAEERCRYPVILKVPDGSFSRGVFKADNRAQLERLTAEMFRHSELILAQAFTYTPFDWRVGVLHGEPLYVSQYFMARQHWQIIKHGAQGRTQAGDARTMAVADAPEDVVKTAVRAARLVGEGLYGVDLKQTDQGVRVIEVNDNPSLDAGVEDAVLGDGLYEAVMNEFLRRLEAG